MLGKFVRKYKAAGSITIAIILLFCSLLYYQETFFDKWDSFEEKSSQVSSGTTSIAAAENVEEVSSETFHAAILRQIARRPIQRSIRFAVLAILLILELGILATLSACHYVRSSFFDRGVIIAYVHKKDGKK
ncbi:MAG: hypothetical protein J6W66_00370 [Lachnospiraceae bacterium]|nr:hypothetical protein [Lachnospiraceae bacterium]